MGKLDDSTFIEIRYTINMWIFMFSDIELLAGKPFYGAKGTTEWCNKTITVTSHTTLLNWKVRNERK